MNAGELRHRVTVQTLTPTRDTEGGRTTAATTLAAGLPCAVESVGRDQGVDGGQLTSTTRRRLRIRSRSDVKPGQRAVVTYRETGLSETFQIESVERGDDRGFETHLYCTAVQG